MLCFAAAGGEAEVGEGVALALEAGATTLDVAGVGAGAGAVFLRRKKPNMPYSEVPEALRDANRPVACLLDLARNLPVWVAGRPSRAEKARDICAPQEVRARNRSL